MATRATSRSYCGATFYKAGAREPMPTPTLFTGLPLDPRSPEPIYRQLYDGVRHAILRGHVCL
jgi:hypothetical protein